MEKRRRVLAVMLRAALFSAFFAAALAFGAKVQAGTDVQIDPDPTMSAVQNEISLTLVPGTQPGRPAVLLAAYNDAGPSIGYSYSTDGGASWGNGQLPVPINPVTGLTMGRSFDPTATSDTLGNLYIGHIADDLSGYSGLYVHKSTNQGLTWLPAVTVAFDLPSSGMPDPNYRFNDRDQMTADTFTSSPYTDNVYIAWIKDRGLTNQSIPNAQPLGDIYFAFSTDLGNTFNLATGFPGFLGRINDQGVGHDMSNMPVPSVAPDGTIYVSWLDYNVWTAGTGIIYLDRSTDGGLTWGADITVTTISLPPLNLTTFSGATDVLAKGAPVLAVSPTRPNEVYIVYAARSTTVPADEADIFFIKSTNGGNNWSSPLKVNSDSTACDQWAPWMEVKPDGTIDIVWYDRRNDAAPMLGDRLWDVYTARSIDGGNSFSTNVQLNDTRFATPTPMIPWMGEYLGLAVDTSYAYAVWTSSVTDSNGDVYFDKIPNWQLAYSSLNGYWRLNENTGDKAADSSANLNTGMLGSAVGADANDPAWTTGISGSALNFDGTNDYVDVQDSSSLDITGPITIEAWIKTTQRTGAIVDKNGFSYSWGGFSFYVGYQGGLRFHIDSGSQLIILESRGTVNDGNWRHVAATWNGSVMRVYIDGWEDRNMTYSGTMTANNRDLCIGAKSVLHNDWFFNGTIDEVAIWSRALSSAEIRARYNHLAPVHNVTSGGYFTTIQNAVSASNASGRDTIQVAAGTYYEYVYINRPVILMGAGSGATTIDGGGGYDVIWIDNSMGNANNVQIENFTIQNPGSSQNGAGIRASLASGVTIRNNTITNNYVGIKLRACTNYTITGNVVTGNTSSNINIDPSNDGEVTHNTVSSSHTGIYVESSSPLIEDNLIKDNYYGIYVQSGRPTIGDNVFSRNVIDTYRATVPLPVDAAFLTPGKLNLIRQAEHSFKIHIYPSQPMDVSAGDPAEVYVDTDGSGTFELDESFTALVSSTDADGEAMDIAVKVYCEDLSDNDPGVAIYSINEIDIVYADELGGGFIEDLVLDTFLPSREPRPDTGKGKAAAPGQQKKLN